MMNRPISPHRLRKFSHRLSAYRDVYANGQTGSSVLVEGLENVPCSAPQPARAEQFQDVEIESFKNAFVVYALVMPASFRNGDRVMLANREYALRHVRRWPELDGKSAELLLETR